MKKYDRLRFLLFTHSYSGKIIAAYIRKQSEGNEDWIEEKSHLLAKVLLFQHQQISHFVFNQLIAEAAPKVLDDLQIFLDVEQELILITSEKIDEY